jgi:sugar (pentulose or hexulose) kinase
MTVHPDEPIRHVAVIDIGKTNAKVAVVDLAAQAEIEVRRMPNSVSASGPYPHHDVVMLWAFIAEALAGLAARNPVDAISITTHGATAALVAADGSLVLPVLDYEHDGPASHAERYAKVRPEFSETGSPLLPGGLNLGAQLFWQASVFEDAFAKVAAILAYPQYWAFRLCGVAASEATSFGCHTDLWNPSVGSWSSLVRRMGWLGLLPELRHAGARLGPVLPGVAADLGLDPRTPVLCGIHDSNASLYPHLVGRPAPFSVVSTGTWVVVMSIGGSLGKLDAARDCLVNVDARGGPVPSARFMGGREFSLALRGDADAVRAGGYGAVLDAGVMLLPSLVEGSGPFPGRRARWVGDVESIEPEARLTAVSWYLAMMTASCLELTGAAGPVVVEGPFAGNAAYLDMLRVACRQQVLCSGGSTTGTSLGAALLAASEPRPMPALRVVPDPVQGGAMGGYSSRWKAELASG